MRKQSHRAQKRKQNREHERATVKSIERERIRTYTRGDAAKNTALMFEVLGSSVNRAMLAYLKTHGAMSITHLSEPFNLTLPAALVRVNGLERAGLIITKKQGKIRFCTYNHQALKELARHVAASPNPFSRP